MSISGSAELATTVSASDLEGAEIMTQTTQRGRKGAETREQRKGKGRELAQAPILSGDWPGSSSLVLRV